MSSTPSSASIEGLFSPKSVAIVGARPELTKPGGRCLSFARRFGYRGAIYPVNTRYTEIDGLRCYADLSELPQPPDLVMLIVGASTIAGHLEKAGAAGARAAVIFSSGFAETGEEGAAMQEELVAIARRHGMALLGPNCLGLIDMHSGVMANFSSGLVADVDLAPGPTAFVSQSGAMGMAVFLIAQRDGVRVGKFISTGNEALYGMTDFVEYLGSDADTSLVLTYVEGLRDGRRFVDVARRARRAGKAVAVLKVGQSEAGEQAARSHTGALSGSAKVYEAAFRRAGVLRADTVQDLLDFAVVSPGARSAASRRVGIITMSGGAGVIMSDACSAMGLEVTTFTEGTLAALGKLLPAYTSFTNPVDYGAIYDDLDASVACIEAVARDPGVAQVLIFFGMSPTLVGRIEARLAALQQSTGKPIIVGWLAGPPEGVRALCEAGVAAFNDPTRAVRAAAALADFGTPLTGLDVTLQHDAGGATGQATRETLQAYLRAGATTLSEREVKTLLAGYGIPVVQEVLARSADEALAAGRKFGRPMAVKAEAPELLHKSDAGAVRLNVAPEDAAAAYEHVVNAAARVVGREGVRGALLQPMAIPGIEVLAGLRYDPQFGPTVTVGMGGVMSEVLADATTELAPIDLATARAMLVRLKGARLLAPFRGAAARDTEALAAALVALSRFAVDAGPLVAELDINPIIVHDAGLGCTAVDGAAVLQAPGAH